MKKTFFLAIALTTLAISCQKNTPQESSPAFNNTESAKLAPGVIPSDIKLHDYMLNPRDYSWKEVDAYYRNEVLVKHPSDSYYNNLRKVTIATLVNQYNLLQNADLETVEFYALELMSVNLPDPEVFVKVFERLKGHWSDKKIQESSLQKYAQTHEFIQNQLKEPEKFLQQQGHKYEAVKTFAESFDSE